MVNRPGGGPKRRKYNTAFQGKIDDYKKRKSTPSSSPTSPPNSITSSSSSQVSSPANANYSSIDGTAKYAAPPQQATPVQNVSADAIFQQATGQSPTQSQNVANNSVLNFDANRESQMQAALEQQDRLRGLGQFSPEGLGRSAYMFTGIEGVGGFIPNPTVDYFIATVPSAQAGQIKAANIVRDPKSGQFISKNAANVANLKQQATSIIQVSRDYWFGTKGNPGAAKTFAKVAAWLGTSAFLQYWGRQETASSIDINVGKLQKWGMYSEAQELIDAKQEVLRDRPFWQEIGGVISGIGPVVSMLEFLENNKIFTDAQNDYNKALLEDSAASELNYSPADGTQSLATPGTPTQQSSVDVRAWEIRDQRKAELERQTAEHSAAQWEIAQSNILQLRDELQRAQSNRERKAMLDQIAQWEAYAERRRKAEAEERERIAEYWLKYNEQLRKLQEENRPSNLGFGLF